MCLCSDHFLLKQIQTLHANQRPLHAGVQSVCREASIFLPGKVWQNLEWDGMWSLLSLKTT